MVTITKTSLFTGKVNTMTLNISQEEFDAADKAWQAGSMVQNAFHMLNADEREFLLTGVTPEEWDATFGGEG